MKKTREKTSKMLVYGCVYMCVRVVLMMMGWEAMNGGGGGKMPVRNTLMDSKNDQLPWTQIVRQLRQN